LVLHENFERLRADQTPLVKTLDQDEDGAISAAEIARAVDTLLKYDRNQDDVISLDELKAAAARTPEKPSKKSPEPAPIIPLADLANREVFARLALRYAAEGGQASPAALTRWDANGDGRIDADELTRLAAARADLQIDVAFDSHDSSRSHVDVTVVDASLGQTPATVRGASVTLLAAGTLLEFSAVQPEGEANVDQISIGAVRDGYPLLPEIDANEDGRLTLRELRRAPQRLAEFDRNGDGDILAGEILPTLRVAIGRGANSSAAKGNSTNSTRTATN
jgi:Ca2+-binding EF-hand superfamily protein